MYNTTIPKIGLKLIFCFCLRACNLHFLEASLFSKGGEAFGKPYITYTWSQSLVKCFRFSSSVYQGIIGGGRRGINIHGDRKFFGKISFIHDYSGDLQILNCNWSPCPCVPSFEIRSGGITAVIQEQAVFTHRYEALHELIYFPVQLSGFTINAFYIHSPNYFFQFSAFFLFNLQNK